jgi:hypothetical protein
MKMERMEKPPVVAVSYQPSAFSHLLTADR